MINTYGLIGRNIGHSFSAKYFSEKFAREGIQASYSNFDLPQISLLPHIIKDHPTLVGLNVTIPYKESVLPFLDGMSEVAREIGAVNTLTVSDGKLFGDNTDYFGFMESLRPLLKDHHTKALILGTGGASKAVAYALIQLGISFVYVSRKASDDVVNYASAAKLLPDHHIVINCTPLGTWPDTGTCPELPYEQFTTEHTAYDLVYNPAETLFLQQAARSGAKTKNGYKMLVLQAERSWEIWNNMTLAG